MIKINDKILIFNIFILIFLWDYGHMVFILHN